MTSKYPVKGLSPEEVLQSRKQHGSNYLPEPEVETFWEKLLDNFQDPLIKILSVALVITVALAFLGYADWFEGVGIAFAVFLATFVSTYSEYKNEGSFRELQEAASKVLNNVFRGNSVVQIPVTEIVKGDFVLLQAGDKVPADGPVVYGFLHCSQASLTGEPEPIRKTPSDKKEAYNPKTRDDLSDPHLVFRGSIVEDGEGVMLIDSIGTETVYGKIMKDINENEEERQSPLELKLSNLADSISTLGYIGASFIFLSFLFKQFVMDQGYSLERTWAYLLKLDVALHDSVTALILAIIIIVVAVPEGLPMMIAIVLSLNMKKLLDKKVLVRRLLGIETAGSVNILFSDKTGTITKGHLECLQFVSGELESHEIREKRFYPTTLGKVLQFSLKHSTGSQVDPVGNIIGGNSSDRAFLGALSKEYLLQRDEVSRVKDILFSSMRKFSASTVQVPKEIENQLPKNFFKNSKVTIVKGAPERILENCKRFYDKNGDLKPLNEVTKISDAVNNLSRQGVRVIAIATSVDPLPNNGEIEVPENLDFIGLVGLRDEVRAEAKHAIGVLQGAFIQVVMVTGDRKETAIAVAREIGLLPPSVGNVYSEDGLPSKSVLTSEELSRLSDDQIASILPKLRVIARALPTDKSRLVKISQKQNLVVGMTGDGVNDAAALKRADVGFAMGSGTEMAKEAADIVIMDDNVNSLVYAVLYGRTIFKSIRKFIIFQSTINMASTIIVFLGPFLGFDFPLTLIQLLWVNLVMDTLAALAFGGEPALFEHMKSPPVKRNEAIVDPYMWSSILFGGAFIATLSIYFLSSKWAQDLFVRGDPPVPNSNVFMTAFFAFFIFISVINAFNVRTKSVNLVEGLLLNRGFIYTITLIFFVQITFTYLGGKILRTVPLGLGEWKWIILASFVIIPLDILRKLFIAPLLPKAIKETPPEIEDKKEAGHKKND